MTNDQERIFIEAVRAIADACRVTNFRCEVFEHGVPSVGQQANGSHHWTDGRCGPGGVAALLRSLAMVGIWGGGAEHLHRALRHAASLTFNTDEEFDRWIGK